MSTDNRTSQNGFGHLFLSAALILLFFNFYYYCYSVFLEWKFTSKYGNIIFDKIVSMGLFKHWINTSGGILLLLFLETLAANNRKNPRLTYRSVLWFLLPGVAIYFFSYLLLPCSSFTEIYIYMGCMLTGYFLIITGAGRLKMVMGSNLKNFFSDHPGGLKQEERLIRTPYSLNFKTRYPYNGRLRKGYINIINPRRGILITGSPGSGKSWFIIEPSIRQLIEKGFSLFVYDYKFSRLSTIAYNHFILHKDKYPTGAEFCCINFTELSRSHRCNVLAPSTMGDVSDAIGASRTILFSINKTWVNRQGEFFVESPVNFLAALIWYLKKYKDGLYCTLPHAIELAQVPYKKLFTLLSIEPEIITLINPFVEAYRNKVMEMLDGQVASAKIPLGRLASPDIYYVLTGNDLSLNINDPAAPKILCLGGDPVRQEALGPVLSLYIDRMTKLCNRQGQHPCAMICDEFATVRAASMITTIGTARSNNVIPILSVQDLSQLETQYSHAEAKQILNITGNLLSGQIGGETARLISERFPGITQYKTSVTMNSSDTSVSKGELMASSVSINTMATLSSGEFVGIVADDPGEKLELKTFYATIQQPKHTDMDLQPLPIVREIHADGIQAIFLQVKKDIDNLVKAEMDRITNDPTLKAFIL